MYPISVLFLTVLYNRGVQSSSFNAVSSGVSTVVLTCENFVKSSETAASALNAPFRNLVSLWFRFCFQPASKPARRSSELKRHAVRRLILTVDERPLFVAAAMVRRTERQHATNILLDAYLLELITGDLTAPLEDSDDDESDSDSDIGADWSEWCDPSSELYCQPKT